MSQDQAKPSDRFDVVEQETKEREAAARDFGHILFGPPESREDTTEQSSPQGPAGSADAGEHGIEPESRKAPAEHLADILLRGEGVREDSRWRQ